MYNEEHMIDCSQALLNLDKMQYYAFIMQVKI